MYAIPAGWVDDLLIENRGYSNATMLDEYGGAFAAFVKYQRFERDGVEWLTLIHPDEWVLEIEVGGDSHEVISLPPWEAWRLARERDLSVTPPTPIESWETAVLYLQDRKPRSHPNPRLPDSAQELRYPPPSFAVSDDALAWYRSRAARGSLDRLRDTIHGPLKSLREYCRLEREGKSWLLAIGLDLWVLAIELTEGDGPAEIHAVPPELARRIVLDPDFGPELVRTYRGPERNG